MKNKRERQRWQPEEDSLLRSYVRQYGPRDWSMVSQRMGTPLDRDPKSCLERWKNYLKPGLKKGSLTQEEQSLVVSLQSKYGNKWKKIASFVPGRTPKRLGKWWEVFKERQLKQQSNKPTKLQPPQSEYAHILNTFAEKHVLLAPAPAAPEFGLWREVEEGWREWEKHRREAGWRLGRVEQQMEEEKRRRWRVVEMEVERRVRRLREEGVEWVGRVEEEWREKVEVVRREAEVVEGRLVGELEMKQRELVSRLVGIVGSGSHRKLLINKKDHQQIRTVC
ncbi:Protein rough sheath 2 [Acorus gramineus]|uniref:Protein rough sheath 2 n=1 Tax=Acorus gramineus TaxID=55184 RepID=A0AAV9BWP0_ACOGR|nr:Protein rough sheath 2 [Acorus gramineus]